MAHIRKKLKQGKNYYYLVEKIKGKVKTLESFGTSPPHKYNPKLIKGFAEEELKQIPDESVDLVIIDPPYGIEYDTGFRDGSSETLGAISLDNEKIFETFPEVIRELFRIMKNNSSLYVFSRWDVSNRFMEYIKKYFRIKNRLNWVKNNWSMGDLYGAYAMQCEDIIYAVKGNPKLNGRRDTDVLNFNRVAGNNLLHSHQKPLELLKFLIDKSGEKNKVLLDCYAGSGSTIIAGVNKGMKTIGIELNDKYLDIIKDRLDKESYFKIKGINWNEFELKDKQNGKVNKGETH